MSKPRRLFATILLSSLVSAASVGQAEETEASHPASRSCIGLVHIRNSEVLDRQHILFTLGGSEMYVNTLPHPCPGLRRDTPWLHRTSLDQVCDLDIITVLNSTGGGFMPAVCVHAASGRWAAFHAGEGVGAHGAGALYADGGGQIKGVAWASMSPEVH